MRLRLIAVFLLTSLSACSPTYVLRAAYEQSRILLNRQKIETVLKDANTSETEREKLFLVLEARSFTAEMGLKPGGSYTTYSRVDKDTLAWIVLASKPDAFELYTWWFPFVGSVPYKGYFEAKDAEKAAKRLEEKGYETWVRGTDAFSTLGWFNDPVLSTVLKSPDTRVVNVVVHETLHRTFWLDDHVDFNESLANFVGLEGARQYFEKALRQCQTEKRVCEKEESRLKGAELDISQELSFALVLEKLYQELQTLYASSKTKEEKLAERERVFQLAMKPLRVQYPKMKILQTVNNAEIMQLKLYLTRLELFQKYYVKVGRDWKKFLEGLNEIKASVKADSTLKPFDVLEKRVQGSP